VSVTKKPCPGCGQVDRSRKADEVCSACSAAIQGWDKHVESLRVQATAGECEFVRLSEMPYAWPSFYFGGGPRCHLPGFDDMREKLTDVLHNLSHRMCEPIPGNTYLGQTSQLIEKPEYDFPMSDGMHGWFSIVARVSKTDLKLLRDLWFTTAEFAHLCFLAGREDGRNLLLEIASGEISPQEFAQADVKIAEQIQKAGRRAKGFPKKKEAARKRM